MLFVVFGITNVSASYDNSYPLLDGYGSINVEQYDPDYISLFPPKKSRTRLHQTFKIKTNVWLTLAPEARTVGPQLAYVKDKVTKNEQNYMRLIFGYILQKAHQLAFEDYYSTCENQEDVDNNGAECKTPMNYTYFAFLVGALTVPYHESYLNHFRINDSEKNCDSRSNTLKNAQNRTVRSIFNEKYKDEENSFEILPSCDYFFPDESTLQVVSSAKMFDLGIMQMNAFYHKDAINPHNYLNIYNFIDIGLNYYYNGDGNNGFNYIRQKIHARYKRCSFRTSPFSSHKGSTPNFLYGLIRGSWHRYNLGSPTAENVCTFSTNSGKSKSFRRSLNAVIKNNSSLYHTYLPEGSDERRALNEIVYNFRAAFSSGKAKKERNYYINKVLKTDYSPSSKFYASTQLLQQSERYEKYQNVERKTTSASSVPSSSIGVVNGTDGGVGNLRKSPSGYADLIKEYKKGSQFIIHGKKILPSGSVWYEVSPWPESSPMDRLKKKGWIWGRAIDI